MQPRPVAHVAKKPLRLDDEVQFFRTWFEKPIRTGAVMPSGKALARRMARCVDPNSTGPVIELGPGTGPVTEALVQHGIDPSMEGGHIEVGGQFDREAGVLRLWVQDSGVGMNPVARPGTGLTNLRARLAALHGPGATLELREVSPHGVRAEIALPTAPARGPGEAESVQIGHTPAGGV